MIWKSTDLGFDIEEGKHATKYRDDHKLKCSGLGRLSHIFLSPARVSLPAIRPQPSALADFPPDLKPNVGEKSLTRASSFVFNKGWEMPSRASDLPQASQQGHCTFNTSLYYYLSCLRPDIAQFVNCTPNAQLHLPLAAQLTIPTPLPMLRENPMIFLSGAFGHSAVA